jgi:hypothetical protein
LQSDPTQVKTNQTRPSGLVTLYFPRKNGHEKRLDWLTYLGLLDKQKITSFSCW